MRLERSVSYHSWHKSLRSILRYVWFYTRVIYRIFIYINIYAIYMGVIWNGNSRIVLDLFYAETVCFIHACSTRFAAIRSLNCLTGLFVIPPFLGHPMTSHCPLSPPRIMYLGIFIKKSFLRCYLSWATFLHF